MEVRRRASTNGIPQEPALLLTDKWLRVQSRVMWSEPGSIYLTCACVRNPAKLQNKNEIKTFSNKILHPTIYSLVKIKEHYLDDRNNVCHLMQGITQDKTNHSRVQHTPCPFKKTSNDS